MNHGTRDGLQKSIIRLREAVDDIESVLRQLDIDSSASESRTWTPLPNERKPTLRQLSATVAINRDGVIITICATVYK